MATLRLPERTSEDAPEERRMSLPNELFELNDYSQLHLERDTNFYSVATGRPRSEVRDQLTTGRRNLTVSEASASEAAYRAAATEEAMMLDTEEAGELISGQIQELQEIEQVSRFLPDSLAAAVRANTPGSRAMAIDRIAKLQYAGEQFSEVLDDLGWNAESVLDFAEVMIDPASITRVPIYRRLTEQFEDLLGPNVSQDDFEEGIESIIRDAMDAGWMSNENRFHFATFLDFLGSGVYSNTARAEAALGWFDIGLTLGTSTLLRGTVTGATTALRGSRGQLNGTTSITSGVVPRGPSGAVVDGARNQTHALSQLQPSARRDEAIFDNTAENILFDEVDAAGTTAPSILTPSTLRHSFYSSAEAVTVRLFEQLSRPFDIFRGAARDSGLAFEDGAFQTFRRSFGFQRFKALQTSGNPLFNGRAIDVDVGIDDFGNIFYIDVIGTNSAQPFTNTPNGLSAARAAMVEGDDLLQNTDGTFVILRRGNISPDNLNWLEEAGYTPDLEGMSLYRSTDPENLGDGFWARFGSPLAQADPETSSYLFRAEGVMNRTMRQIHRETRSLTRRMRQRDVTRVYGVFDHLASIERQRAYTRDEFVSWYSGEYSTPPTDRQVQLYVLEQARLDAEMLINTNEYYRNAVDMGAVALREGSVTHVVRPVEGPIPGTGRRVYDPVAGRNVDPDELPEGTLIYENIGAGNLPAEARYVIGSSENIRAVRHSDFIVRNAGGHRGYVLNEMQFIVKQVSSTRYAGGIDVEGSPLSLFGARTAAEARRGAEEVNNILKALHEAFPIGRMSRDEYLDLIESSASSPAINRVIADNSSWNPQVTDVESLVSRFRTRGADLRRPFDVAEEGKKLDTVQGGTSGIFRPRSGTMADLTRMQLMRGGRAVEPLPRYGGGNVTTRNAEEVIQGSFARAAAYSSELAYRTRAGRGLVQAAREAGVFTSRYFDEGIDKLPIRSQIKMIAESARTDKPLIDASGAKGAKDNIGRRLVLDARRLDFRMNSVSPATKIWRNITRNLSNYLYGKGWEWGAKKVDRWSTDPISAMRGLAFDAYLGFFNPAQLYMQSVQAVNIVAIAGFKGLQGAALYPAVRFALANGNPAVIRRLGESLEGTTGLSADEFVDMVETFKRTGRDIVDMNLAEMSSSEAEASMLGTLSKNEFTRTAGTMFRGVRELGRIPFKEGDLVARVTAYNAAYLEAVARFGSRTPKNTQQFSRFVDWRQQVLTQGMTAASRQAYEQLPFMQFMTYQLRINEAIFSGTLGGKSRQVLTNWERTKLGLVHLSMFGLMATTPTAIISQWYMAKNDVELDPEIVRAIQRGALDAGLSYLTESETAASSRLASSMGIWNALSSMSREGWQWFLGPGIGLGWDGATSMFDVVVEGINAVKNGNSSSFMPELSDFVRLTSTGNQTYNAWLAYRYGEFVSRKDQVITGSLDPGLSSDAIFTAFGIPLEEVAGTYEFMGMQSLNRRVTLDPLANQLTELHRRVDAAVRAGNMDEAAVHFQVIGELRGMLEPWELDYIDRKVDDSVVALDDRIMLQLLIQESEYLDRVRED